MVKCVEYIYHKNCMKTVVMVVVADKRQEPSMIQVRIERLKIGHIRKTYHTDQNTSEQNQTMDIGHLKKKEKIRQLYKNKKCFGW